MCWAQSDAQTLPWETLTASLGDKHARVRRKSRSTSFPHPLQPQSSWEFGDMAVEE